MRTRRSFKLQTTALLGPDSLCSIAKVSAEHERDDIAECVMQQRSVKDEKETLFKILLHVLDLEPTDPIVHPPVTLCSTHGPRSWRMGIRLRNTYVCYFQIGFEVKSGRS